MTLKVLHLIGGGEIGGAEQSVLSLLNASYSENLDVHLGCLVQGSPFADLAQSQGFVTSVFPMRFAFDLFPLPAIVRFCRNHHIDILHCHGSRANLLGRLAARRASIPCVSTVHSLPEYDYPSSVKGLLALRLDNITLPLSSGIITVSSSLKESVSLRLKKKELHLPLRTVYNGMRPLDFSSRQDMRSAFRQQYGIEENRTVIGSIGRLHPVKGQQYLIEAMHILSKEFDNLHLVLIGDGPDREHLQKLLHTYQISYTTTGYLSSAWKALPALDLFVLPSINEGMGLVLLEAAQAQVPIVASRTGGIPELFSDGSEVLLCQPADPMDLTISCSNILRNHKLSLELTEKARQRAKVFTVEKMASDTAAFYHEVLDALYQH